MKKTLLSVVTDISKMKFWKLQWHEKVQCLNSKSNKCAERLCKGRETLKKFFKRQSGSSKVLDRNQLKNKTCSIPIKIQTNVCLVGLWKLTHKFQWPCTMNSLLKKNKRRVICYTRYLHCWKATVMNTVVSCCEGRYWEQRTRKMISDTDLWVDHHVPLLFKRNLWNSARGKTACSW